MADRIALTNGPTRDKVCISNLNPGVVRHEFLASILGLVVYDVNHNARIGHLRPMMAGGLLDIYRNMAVESFFAETDCEWLLFVDSDIQFEPDAVDRLLAVADPVERPVVSALYMMTLDDGIFPSMSYRVREGESIRMRPMPREEIPEDEVYPVDACGCGFLLIHRSILEGMYQLYDTPAPWFANEIFDGIIYGEDYTFCMRVAQMGFQVYVHTGVKVGHCKSYVLTHETEVHDVR